MHLLSKKLRDGAACVGLWLMTPSLEFGELVRTSGIDFVVIDLEHGLHTLDTLLDMLRCVQGGRTAAIVRVPSHDHTLVSRVLDRGADGVMIPRVDDRETAIRVAAAVRFPPNGERGLALRALRATGFGVEDDYRARSDREVVVMVQLESRTAIEDAIAIGGAPGVDLAFIGPADLAANMRLEGPEHKEEFRKLVDGKIGELHEAGIRVGTVPFGDHDVRSLVEAGAQLVVAGSDIGIMSNGLRDFRLNMPSGSY